MESHHRVHRTRIRSEFLINSPPSIHRWRLLLLLPLLIVVLSDMVESRRFGFPAKTLHFPDIPDDRILEIDSQDESVEKSFSSPNEDTQSSSSPSFPSFPSSSSPNFRSRRSASRPPPKVTLANLNTTQHKVVVHWAGEGSKVIIALATGILGSSHGRAKIFVSTDYGHNFVEKESDLQVNKFYTSPVLNSHYIFTDVNNNLIYTTTNYLSTLHLHHVPFRPDELSLHPSNHRVVVGLDKHDDSKPLYVSRNFGNSWATTQAHVNAFFWGVPEYDPDPLTLYIERKEPAARTGTGTVLRSPNAFAFGSQVEVIAYNVIDFHVYDSYLLATKHNGTDLDLWVSYNRSSMKRAEFEERHLPHKDYFVADASEDQIFLCVNHGTSQTNLYISEAQGISFSLSLENIVYFNPKTSSSWMAALSHSAFADVHKVEGLRGIYIASVIQSNGNSSGSRPFWAPVALEDTVSVITFDKGGVWSRIKPPAVDSDGKEIPCAATGNKDECSLHLTQRLSQMYPGSRASPILSKSSAPGIIMATGVVGKSLKDSVSVYLSTTAGNSWYNVLPGFHAFLFGDHGGVMMAVKQFSPTKEALYSVDGGESWSRLDFADESVVVYGLLTEPGEKSTVFTLFGARADASKRDGWIVVQIDTKPTLGADCRDADYKTWSPSDDAPSQACLLGRRQFYKRRLAHRPCFNGRNFDRATRVENCTCTREDFECDEGYAPTPDFSRLFGSPDCVWVGGVRPPSIPHFCPEGGFHFRSRGFRRVSGDTCVGGDAQWAPEKLPCPVGRKQEFLLYSDRQSLHRFVLGEDRDELLPLGSLRNAIAVDYDYSGNCAFWADIADRDIKRACLDGNSENQRLVGLNGTVEGLAYDWISENLYWVETTTVKIEICRKDGSMRRTLLNATSGDLKSPRAIALAPQYGIMFWSDWGNNRITRAALDGSQRKVIVSNQKDEPNIISWPNGVAIDFEAKRVYWTDARLDSISSTDWNGADLKVVLKGASVVPHPYGIGIYKSNMYWTDWARQAVMTADKNSGLRLRVVKSDLSGVMDLKVLHLNSQTGHNGCLSRNIASCPGLCVGMPSGSASAHAHHSHPLHFQLTNNRTCLCPNGLKREQSHDPLGNERCVCHEAGQIFANGTCMFKNDTCDAKSQFQCGSHKRCIPKAWVCDKDNDCGDMSDEHNCPSQTCLPFQFQCLNTSRCIVARWRCDGDNDCGDNSDEMSCDDHTCKPGEHRCLNGRCIKKEWLCDFDDDCHDGSDEKDCTYVTTSAPATTEPEPETTCNPNQFPCQRYGKWSCIPLSWHCDGEADCDRGRDEVGCNHTLCNHWQFQCHNDSRCIFKSWRCDGANDCADGSDEFNCSSEIPTTAASLTTPIVCANNEFPCSNGHCVDLTWRCDGVNDCGDDSDEWSCSSGTTTAPTLPAYFGTCRLLEDVLCVPAEGSECGREVGWKICDFDAAVHRHFQWHCLTPQQAATLCGSVFPESTEAPTCPSYMYDCGDSLLGNVTQKCVYQAWVCDGQDDCGNGHDELHCPTKNETTCSAKDFACERSVGCIPMRYVCDGEPDCSDSSDEFYCANSTGDVPTLMPGACPGLSPFEWDCADKELCIMYGQVCDGIVDCTDGSDEKECGQTFKVKELMVHSKTVTPFNFTLSWNDLTVPVASKTEFRPAYRDASWSRDDDGDGDVANSWTNLTDTEDTSVVFKNMRPWTEYEVAVFVVPTINNEKVTTYPAVTTRVHTSEWVPSPPLNVKAGCFPSAVADILGSCWVRWDRPRQLNGRITAYEIYYKRTDRKNPQVLRQSINWAQPKMMNANLTDLDPGFDYTVWVRGVTFRAGPPSNLTHVRLAGDSISTPPNDLQLNVINETSVNASWSNPAKAKSVEGYVVYYWPAVVSEDENRRSINVSSPVRTWALVKDLAPATWYAFAVAAYNSAGHGPDAEKDVQTGGAPLKALTDLKAVLTETSTTAFNVSWTESSPLSPASSSRRYRLSWGLTEEELRWNVIETSNTSVLVKDLLSCEDYIFSVQRIAPSRSKTYVKGKGKSSGFLGPESKIINQTGSDPKAPPKRPGAKYRKRDKSIYIQWEAPCSLESGRRNVTYALNITDDVGNSVYFKPAPSTKRKNTFILRKGLTRGAHYFITVSTDVKGSRPSTRIIIDVPPLPEPRNFALTEINVLGATALFLEWETPKGISKSDNATTYVVWMAHKEVVPDDDNDETSSRRHRRFHYENVKTTTSKQFVFSELRPAVKYAFRVSVQLPDRRHFGSKSSVIYYTSPKDLPPPTAASSTLAIPKTSAIVGGLFVGVAVVVCFFLVALYHRRQKRLEASLERLHQSLYDRRAGVTFLNGEDSSGGGGAGVVAAPASRRSGGRGVNNNRRLGTESSSASRNRSADRVGLLEDMEEYDDDDVVRSVNAEAETFQPFQSFSTPNAERNEADDDDAEIVSEEQMNNERNNALTNNNGASGGRRRNDDDEALLLVDDFDDGPVITAFAFSDEPPMIIA